MRPLRPRRPMCSAHFRCSRSRTTGIRLGTRPPTTDSVFVPSPRTRRKREREQKSRSITQTEEMIHGRVLGRRDSDPAAYTPARMVVDWACLGAWCGYAIPWCEPVLAHRHSRGRTEMLRRLARACVTAMAMASSPGLAQSPSPNGVKTLDPPGAIKAEGTWSLGARAGDFVFVAGMQGVDPATNTLVPDPEGRIRQAFLNIKLIAQSEGASLQDCVRLTVYVSDLHRFAPMVEKAQAELWGKPPYPPRTMIEVQRLFDDDIVEVDSVFYAPMKK